MDGAIKFNVSANTAQFDASMGRVRSVAASTATAVSGAFAGLGSLLVGGALIGGLTNILQKMDDISDRARRFGVSVEEIQKVGNAAEIVGTNFEAVARAMDRTGVVANKTAREGGKMASAFERINLDPAAFAAANLQERIEMIAKAQQAANGDSAKMAELFEVIGVRAAGINFVELAKEMGDVNAASSKTVEELAKANDLLTKMQQNATIFGANLLKALIVDPAQRLGSFLAGEGFRTLEEVEKKYARKRAEDRLRAQGMLLPDDSTRVPRSATDLRPGSPYETTLGPNALENERRIQAEMDRVTREKAEAERALRDTINNANEMGAETEADSKPDAGSEARGGSGTRRAKLTREQQLELLQPRLREIEEIYKREIEAINSSSASLPEQTKARIRLDAEYLEAKRQAIRQMTTEAATPEAARKRAESTGGQAAAATTAEADKIATETTLQKVANFLEQLNTKLPQPVLV